MADMNPTPEEDVLDRAAAAALALAKDRPWTAVTLRDIAATAGLPFADLYVRASSKRDVLDWLSRRFDLAALKNGQEDEVHDRLFDAVMRRIEAMEPHRAALVAIARAEGAEVAALRLPRTARALLESAGVDASGWRGALRLAAMTAVWARVLQVWRDDAGALNRTMAEIDRRLKQMRERLGQVGAGF
jgi:AcrR family transcriptional regulator